MRCFLTALLVFSTSCAALGGEPTATEKAVLEFCSERYLERVKEEWSKVQECAERVELIRHADLRSTIVKPVVEGDRAFFPRASMKAKYLAKAEQLLAEAKKAFGEARDGMTLYSLTPMMPWTPKVGSLGTIGGVRVLQIVGKDQMLGERRILDDRQTYWIKGIDTSNMADDQVVPLRAMFVCVGNKTYETVSGGTNTVMVVEPFDMTNVKKLWKPPSVKLPPLPGEAEKEAETAPTESKYRKWTSADGKFAVEAELSYVIGDTVVLIRKDNGEKIEVAKQLLSNADQKWLESRAGQ